MATDPFSYAERFNPSRANRGRPLDAPDVDPITAEIRRQRNNELAIDIAVSPPPEQVARATRLARKVGVAPVEIEDDLDGVERAQNATALSVLGLDHPAIGQFFAANPRAAVTAQDDAESLGLLGLAWKGLSNIKYRGRAGMLDSAAGLIESGDAGALGVIERLAGSFTDFNPLRAPRQAIGKALRGVAEGQRQQGRADNWAADAALSGIESLPLTAAAIATRNPILATSIPALSVRGNAVAKAREQGLSENTAQAYGAVQGGIEYATERLPMGALVEAVVKRTPFGKTLAREILTDLPGEQAATALQDLTDWAMLPENKGKTFGDYLAARPDAAAQTVIASMTGSVVSTTIATGAERTLSAASKIADRRAAVAEAKETRQFIDRSGKAAEGSKLRQRDPEAYNEVLRAQAEEAGVSTVLIPGEALQTYMQSDSYDADRDPFRDYADQIGEAAALGGDVVMPVEFALGALPGTNAWSALKDHMRLSPGGMSRVEADEFEATMEDTMAEMTDRMSAVEAEQAKERTAREKLAQSIATQLGESYTTGAAQTMAEVAATYLQNRAARLGVELTGNEFSDVDIRQVLPEALGQARAADATDLVINAMRRGQGSFKQGGPSLLEWVAKRGGINDTGGDLASMGLGEWHKAKRFRKKLLRDFDPQAAMGGVTGQGDYSIDSTLRAAVDEGFFPELQGVDPTELDTQALLDAFDAELAGSPRYAADAKVDRYRAAAEELKELLESKGLDPAAQSDAELRAEIERLSEESGQDGFEQGSEPIASLTGEEIAPKGVSTKDLRAAARKWYDDTLKGTTVASAALGGREVAFRSSRKAFSSSADPRKLRAFAAVREIIAKAPLIETTEPVDRQLEPSTKAYHYLEAPVEIGGKIEIVGLMIREDANGDIYYNHSIRERAARNPEETAGKAGPGESGGALNQIAENRDDFNLVVKSLKQRTDVGPRGRIVFDQGRTVIELFQSRNLSTFLHEFGHMALENLQNDAALPDAPESLKADWKAVQDWFKANKISLKDGVPVEAHELWARGFERYLMEGKAPSQGLKRIFETIRSWMLSIYKTVDALRSPITPEVREVMDRLLATEEEIAAARENQMLDALFKDAASVGMTDAEFAAYGQQVEDSRAEAHGKLVEKTLAAVRRRETKAYKENRISVREGVVEEVAGLPLYRVLRLAKDTPLSEQWIRDEMGEDALSLLPKRVPPIYRDGGANPSSLAEMAGYATGKQMIEVLIGAEAAHRQAKEGGDKRSMREREIETRTDAEMERRYGDPLGDGSIERDALAAVHNDMAGEVIASEIRVLARRTGQRPTPYALAKSWARGKVRAGSYVNEASPAAIQRHARNAAKAGREAEKAFLKQDIEEAFRQKQFQMLNSALLSEAKVAHDEVQAAVKRMGRIATRATMKSVDQDYLEQTHALLEQVDLKQRTQKSIDRKERWADWAAAREAEGFDIVVPPSFAEMIGTTNWSRLPVEDLLGLDEAVKQVIHLGRLKQTLLDNQEEREWDAIFAEAVDGAGNLKGKPPADLAEPGWWDSVKSNVAGIDASLLKMETVFDWLDGGKSNGVFNRIAFRPVADAQARERDMLVDYYGRIKALFEAVPVEVVSKWRDIETPPFIDPLTERPMRVSRQQVVAMALNVGNEGNLQRLADGYRVNPGALIGYLGQTLTAEEWQFVQGVWDTIDTLWPEIERLERSVNGIAPEKIEARSFETSHGTLRGGYYPAVYDTSRDYRAEENQGKESDLFEGRYTRATTRASATKERSEQVKRPILLDLGVINRHLGEVIHDVTHREAVIRANRFLSSAMVRRAVDDALGPEIGKQLRPWVKHVANSWATERAGNEGFGKWLGKLRANVTAVGMGLRATTMVSQIAGYSNSVEVVGEAAMAKALARFSASPLEATRFVMERSGEVRHRMDTLDRDVRAEVNRLSASNPVSKAAGTVIDGRKFFFHGIGYMDRLVSVPTWMAGYSNALAAGMSEEDARYAGDKAVRQSQGSGAPKDLAAIQRGTGKWGEALKLMTMFYSYFSAQYQRERTLARDVMGSDARRLRNLPKLASRAFFLLIAPPLLTEVLRGAVGADAGPDDDEWWLQWLSRKLLANAIGPIPVARDVFEPAWNAARGGRVFAPSISPVTRALESFVNAAGDAGKIARGDETKHATKDALEAAGYLTGLVPGQVASATQFLVDVGSGDVDPQGFSDWIEGLSTGKLKQD